MGPEDKRAASSRGISVVFEAFFLDTSEICNNWSLTFRKSYGEQINCKIVLDFLRKPPGFHTTARGPKRAQLHRRFKHHQNSTRRPPEREREKEKERKWRWEREKRAKIWAVRRREVPRRGPEGWCPEGWGPEGCAGPNQEKVGPRRVGGRKVWRPQSCGGFTRQPESPNVHISFPAFDHTTKI